MADDRTEAEKAIRAIEDGFNEAWGRHDANGMVRSLTEDAEFITVNGAWESSREGFRNLMIRLHGPTGPFRASTRDASEFRIRFLSKEIAVVHTRFHIHNDVDEPERNSVGMRVVQKINGEWHTVAVQNTDVRIGRRH
jgi:uncharacterized protein (TIGR02246 family)